VISVLSTEQESSAAQVLDFKAQIYHSCCTAIAGKKERVYLVWWAIFIGSGTPRTVLVFRGKCTEIFRTCMV